MKKQYQQALERALRQSQEEEMTRRRRAKERQHIKEKIQKQYRRQKRREQEEHQHLLLPYEQKIRLQWGLWTKPNTKDTLRDLLVAHHIPVHSRDTKNILLEKVNQLVRNVAEQRKKKDDTKYRLNKKKVNEAMSKEVSWYPKYGHRYLEAQQEFEKKRSQLR